MSMLNQLISIQISYQIIAILIFVLISYAGVLIVVKKRLKQDALSKKFYKDSVAEVNNVIDKIKQNEATMSYFEKVDRELKQARSNMNVQQYIMLLILSVLVIILITYAILANFLIAIPIGAVGLLVPKYILSTQRNKFLKKFDHDMIKALRRMASVLRAGGSLENALIEVCESTIPQYVKNEFMTVLATYKAGFPIQEAFYKLYESVGSPDTLFLCVAVDIQMEIGGDKAEVFDTIATTMSNRNLKNRHIKAKLEEIRVTSNILTLMPVPFAIVMYFFNPSQFSYFTANMQGRLTAFGILLFLVAGYFVNKRLSKID